MNQLREWTGQCQRCNRKTNHHTMSMFDVRLICFECSDMERKHPDYSVALEAECKAVKAGDYNFPGIGLPSNLKPGMEWENIED
mgnify:CR=1 FL=1